MKSYLQIQVFIILFLLSNFLVSCASTRKLSLSDLDVKFKNYEKSELDPLSNSEKEIPVTNKPVYDTFFEQGNRTILFLQLAEKTIEVYTNHKNENKDISKEMEVALNLQETLPSIIASIPSLIASGEEIQKNIDADFAGTQKAMLPAVSVEITQILKGLGEYSPKSASILEEINRIRSNVDNFSEKKVDEVKEDIKENDSSLVQIEERNIEADRQEDNNVSQLKKRDFINDSPSSNKDFIYKKISPELGTKIKSPRILDENENLTNEEKLERDYKKEINAGLIRVFQAESINDVASLTKILKNHSIPRIRAASAYALGRLKKGRISLEKAIDTDGFVVRTAAYKSLAEIGDKKSLSYFIEGIRSEDPEIKAASFHGLGKTKDPVGRELILGKGLTSELIIVIAESLRGLAYFKVPVDIDLIQRYISVDEKELQLAAIDALILHNTPESLKSLEDALDKYPKLTNEILDAIGKSKELAATFFLVRASQIYEDEKVIEKVGQLLLKRKAFGDYALVVSNQDSLRMEPNERASSITNINKGDVGILKSSTKKRYVVRIEDELVEDVYRNILVENRILGSKTRYVSGWVFGKKIQLITINKPKGTTPARLKNIQTGKHQNIFQPIPSKPNSEEKESSPK